MPAKLERALVCRKRKRLHGDRCVAMSQGFFAAKSPGFAEIDLDLLFEALSRDSLDEGSPRQYEQNKYRTHHHRARRHQEVPRRVPRLGLIQLQPQRERELVA